MFSLFRYARLSFLVVVCTFVVFVIGWCFVEVACCPWISCVLILVTFAFPMCAVGGGFVSLLGGCRSATDPFASLWVPCPRAQSGFFNGRNVRNVSFPFRHCALLIWAVVLLRLSRDCCELFAIAPHLLRVIAVEQRTYLQTQ